MNNLRRREVRKAVVPLKGKKQDASKCAVNIGQSDEHVVATRPDVQRVRFQRVLAIRTSRNCQLLIPVIQIFLGKVEAHSFEHLAAYRRCRTITSDDDVGLHSSLSTAGLVTQMDGARVQIYTHTALLKEDSDALRLSSLHQRNI